MQQIIQNLSNGDTVVADVPCPACPSRHVLIRTARSLVSLGTERSLVEFGRASLVEKARRQPDKVKLVLDKVRNDGVGATYEAVKSKLDQPVTMGYCNAGTVLESGDHGFSPGDRVVSNGIHAEIVCVPRNLVARVPDTVPLEAACFAPAAAIALQGIRLSDARLGERVAVMGLGLIGILAVQLLRAQGCNVFAIDLDSKKVERARAFGALGLVASTGDDNLTRVLDASDGHGLDAVIVCASTASSDPISSAARMCRKRGRIVLVGVTGLELRRDEFYEKELSFQVSCSYGPGRYDPAYEEDGEDYPIGFVRWTGQRNFEAVLDLMASGDLDVTSLISSQHRLSDAASVYAELGNDPDALGIVLDYDAARDEAALRGRRVQFDDATLPPGRIRRADMRGNEVVVGAIGAGNYASRVLLPALLRTGVRPHVLVSSGGTSAAHHGRARGFALASSDPADAFDDDAVNLIVIATRHDSHADYVCRALESGKHVFVEKPLAITFGELDAIESVWRSTNKDVAPCVMVGFNRRFAPHIVRMKALLDAVDGPKSFVATMNAGAIPADSWVQSRTEGGGRIVGEACHLIDLLRHLAGHGIVSVSARAMRARNEIVEDVTAITLGFADGSLGTVHYYANGSRSYPKERVEAYAAGRTLVLDNFRTLRGHDWPGFKSTRSMRQDKGQDACIRAFVAALRDGSSAPIPMAEQLEVSRATIEAAEIARAG